MKVRWATDLFALASLSFRDSPGRAGSPESRRLLAQATQTPGTATFSKTCGAATAPSG
jgi:hypothetical protein